MYINTLILFLLRQEIEYTFINILIDEAQLKRFMFSLHIFISFDFYIFNVNTCSGESIEPSYLALLTWCRFSVGARRSDPRDT